MQILFENIKNTISRVNREYRKEVSSWKTGGFENRAKEGPGYDFMGKCMFYMRDTWVSSLVLQN